MLICCFKKGNANCQTREIFGYSQAQLYGRSIQCIKQRTIFHTGAITSGAVSLETFFKDKLVYEYPAFASFFSLFSKWRIAPSNAGHD